MVKRHKVRQLHRTFSPHGQFSPRADQFAWLRPCFKRRLAPTWNPDAPQGRQKTTSGDGIAVGGVAAAAAAAVGARAQAAAAGVPDFYRFQQRERRRDELFQLREQFEVDKRKIAELKAARR